jgi:hypothetical protein
MTSAVQAIFLTTWRVPPRAKASRATQKQRRTMTPTTAPLRVATGSIDSGRRPAEAASSVTASSIAAARGDTASRSASGRDTSWSAAQPTAAASARSSARDPARATRGRTRIAAAARAMKTGG